MFGQQRFADLRSMNMLLHGGGVLGLALLLSIVCWFSCSRSSGDVPADSNATSAFDPARLLAVHSKLTVAENELQVIETRLNALSRHIPAEAFERSALNDIVEVAKETGLALTNYEPAPAVARSGYRQLPIRLTGSADYRGICRFLDRIDHMTRLATIEALEIASSADAAMYPVSLTLAVYYTEPPKANVAKGGGRNG